MSKYEKEWQEVTQLRLEYDVALNENFEASNKFEKMKLDKNSTPEELASQYRFVKLTEKTRNRLYSNLLDAEKELLEAEDC